MKKKNAEKASEYTVYVCPECRCVNPGREDLVEHIKETHENFEEILKKHFVVCGICFKDCKNEKNLVWHLIERHSDEEGERFLGMME